MKILFVILFFFQSFFALCNDIPKHVTDGIIDKTDSIWVTTEDGGVYCQAKGPSGDWQRMSLLKGFPSTRNCYSIAQDKQGRIWVGTDDQGLVVFNGETWKQYNRDNGLLSERINDIAISPKSGKVAIATQGGVSIYDPKLDGWYHRNRFNGLKEDQVSTLAFTKNDDLYLGYACQGVSRASSSDYYQKWSHTQAPYYWDNKQYLRQSPKHKGKGLASNLSNCLLIDQEDTVWHGSTCGLSLKKTSSDWTFYRGKNYLDKYKGSYGVTKDIRTSHKASDFLLLEDYVSCITDQNKDLYLGFRDQGVMIIDKTTLKTKETILSYEEYPGAGAKSLTLFPITSILPKRDGSLYLGSFGGGVIQAKQATQELMVNNSEPTNCNFPSTKILDETSLNELIKKFEDLEKTKSQQPAVVYLKDDWTSKGDWCQRYGATFARLFAMNAPYDCPQIISNFAIGPHLIHKIVPFEPDNPKSKDLFQYGAYDVFGCTGLMKSPDDTLRAWLHWYEANHNNNVLYNPCGGYRRESEWDDHGEAYSMNIDGPDIWLFVYLPKGRHIVSLYFYNPNGRITPHEKRDYLIEFKKYEPKIPITLVARPYNSKLGENKVRPALEALYRAPVDCRSRVKDFSGSGVYKNFLVSQEGMYSIRICRNNSFNTIVNGIMIETLHDCSPYNGPEVKQMIGVNEIIYKSSFYYAESEPSARLIRDSDIKDPEIKLFSDAWKKFNTSSLINDSTVALWNQTLLSAYRTLKTEQKSVYEDIVYNLKWTLGIWDDEGRASFLNQMSVIIKKLQRNHGLYISKSDHPYTPGTVPFSSDELEIMRERGINWEDYLSNSNNSPKIPLEDLKKQLQPNNHNENLL